MTRPATLDTLRDKLEAESRRAIRIETRLVRLMEYLGLDPNGSVPAVTAAVQGNTLTSAKPGV